MKPGRRIIYSTAEMRWLEANRTLIISDFHRAFCKKFSRDDVTAQHLHALRKRRRWLVGRAPGRFVGRHVKFSAAEIAWLRDNAKLVISEYHQAFCKQFDRTDMSAPALNALRKRKKWKTGRTGHFEKGRVSPNKGKPNLVAKNNPNCRRTQFKKGQQPQNTKYAGHEFLHPNGYVMISVNERNPHTGFERRYVLKHQRLWEKENGPVPEGYVLKCLDSNKQNADPANWECVPRGLVARLNGGPRKKRIAYDAAPAELKPTIMATAKLSHRISERRARK